MVQTLEDAKNYTKQRNNINDLYNQRKIYLDNNRFLGTENAHALYYPLCHMDILIWSNIYALGEDPELIDKTITLSQLNITVDGYSMFHYFAKNPDIIEKIHLKIQKHRELGFVNEMDAKLTL